MCSVLASGLAGDKLRASENKIGLIALRKVLDYESERTQGVWATSSAQGGPTRIHLAAISADHKPILPQLGAIYGHFDNHSGLCCTILPAPLGRRFC